MEHPQPAPVKQASVSPPAREPARQQAVIASPRQLSRTPVQPSQPLLGDLGIGTPGGPPLHEVRLYGPPAAGRQCSDHQHDHVYLEHRAKLLICLTSAHPSGARPCSRMATVTMLLMRCCPGASGRSTACAGQAGARQPAPGSKRLMLQLRPVAASRLYGGHRLAQGRRPQSAQVARIAESETSQRLASHRMPCGRRRILERWVPPPCSTLCRWRACQWRWAARQYQPQRTASQQMGTTAPCQRMRTAEPASS